MAFLVIAFLTLLPNFVSCLFYISYGAARVLEKKSIRCKFLKRFPLSYISLEPLVSFFDSLAYASATTLDFIGRLFHSYEVEGLNNIPRDRAALLIYYHGVMPMDMLYLPARLYLTNGRVVRGVADRFLFLIPIWSHLVKDYIFPGPTKKCVSTLKRGHLLQISPGGVREALFSTWRYETIWNKRCGFARVAREAQVDIVPIFTRNIRNVFIVPEVFQHWLRPVYEWFRLPVVPLFGGFPVKLVTYAGEPIQWNTEDSPEELAVVTRKAIEQLITTHQTFPATLSGALGERFRRSRAE